MGSLTDLPSMTEEVPVPGTDMTITVRGLGVEDAAELFRLHGEALGSVFTQVDLGGENTPSAQDIAKMLMMTAPVAVAQIIALANDNPRSLETVRKLSAPVQIECLAAIARLTFHSEAEAKKLVETVILGSGAMTSMLMSLGVEA